MEQVVRHKALEFLVDDLSSSSASALASSNDVITPLKLISRIQKVAAKHSKERRLQSVQDLDDVAHVAQQTGGRRVAAQGKGNKQRDIRPGVEPKPSTHLSRAKSPVTATALTHVESQTSGLVSSLGSSPKGLLADEAAVLLEATVMVILTEPDFFLNLNLFNRRELGAENLL